MKPIYLITTTFIFLNSCGSTKKNPLPETNHITSTTIDSIRDTIAETDTIPKMTIPPPGNYNNKKSPALTNWIKTNLIKATGELDSVPALELLTIIDTEVLPENKRFTKGKYYQTERDSNMYLVAIEANCSQYNQILILFKINRANNTLKQFVTYYGEDCGGVDSHYGGNYESFEEFGNYFSINVYHSSIGMEELSHIIINDNFKELNWLEGYYSNQQELETPNEFSEITHENDYSFRHDTLIQSVILRGKKYKKKKDLTFDIRWKCYPDTFICIDKDLLKKYNKTIDEMNSW